MYLIHFYMKNNIKMHFKKVGFLKFQNRFRHSLSIASGEINFVDISKDFTIMKYLSIKKKLLLYI